MLAATNTEVDNYALSQLRRCPTAYRYRITEGLVPIQNESPALTFGQAVHDCIHQWWMNGLTEALALAERYRRSIDALQDPIRTSSRLLDTVEGYHNTYCGGGPYSLYSSEECYSAPIPGTPYTYVGKLDRVLIRDGMLHACDTKTMTKELSANQTSQLEMEPQFRGYVWLLKQLQEELNLPVADVFVFDQILLHKKDTLYRRHHIKVPDYSLTRWLRSTITYLACADTLSCAETGNCAPFMKGICPYYALCSTSDEVASRLKKSLYRVQPWNPRTVDNERTVE